MLLEPPANRLDAVLRWTLVQSLLKLLVRQGICHNVFCLCSPDQDEFDSKKAVHSCLWG
jgi:hypothetical protein